MPEFPSSPQLSPYRFPLIGCCGRFEGFRFQLQTLASVLERLQKLNIKIKFLLLEKCCDCSGSERNHLGSHEIVPGGGEGQGHRRVLTVRSPDRRSPSRI